MILKKETRQDNEGQLQVCVFGQNQGQPLRDADVQITPRGDSADVLMEEFTDDSGQTALINLPSPPVEFSLSPNSEKPYSTYDVMVRLNGFNPTLIQGVQIFSGEIAIQNVFLRESFGGNSLVIISINDNTLWGNFPPKIYEEEVKPLPPPSDLVVLPEPVIPEYIIVHAGLPTNSSAPNYWVPFRDYIKNVASCEIYSTWPEETIKSNVLAIISFTLNRVFTEWYRNKGYNFTITNSTAYDHAFDYGRNIYANISVIVDEIFNNYITRPNIRQPLLAQYCDGIRVSCPNWMTQWGSKDLGDKGYDAVSILRNFYGQDIYLRTAEKVEGVPSSFPRK